MTESTASCLAEVESEVVQDILLKILNELEKSNICYALLHPGDSGLPDTHSDVDIVVGDDPIQSVKPSLERVCKDSGAILIQELYYDVPNGYYFVLAVPHSGSTRYLQLDCIHDPLGIGRYHLNTGSLLKDRYRYCGYYRVSRTAETLYLCVKRALKGNATVESIREDIAEGVAGVQDQERALLVELFGRKLTERLVSYAEKKQYKQLAELINSSKWHIERRFLIRHPLKVWTRLIYTIRRTIRRVLKPTGFFIVLLGPDGCGKTTVSQSIREKMERAFRKQWRFHWRPKFFPKLGNSSPMKPSSSNANAAPQPPEEARYGSILSFIRFIYYWADFVIGYWLVIYPRKVRSTIIVGERYFGDILVHPARYGFKLPHWLMRLFSYLVPHPNLTIQLSGDPQTIHNRKPELTVSVIEAQTKRYENEITYWGEHFIVDVNQHIEQVTADIEHFCFLVLQRRLNKPSMRKRVAFPRYGRTRLLLDKNVASMHLDALYQPSSIKGKAAISFYKYIPLFSRFVVARKTTSVNYARFPVARADTIIRECLGNDSIEVSYYMGNGGPRSKITAQATLAGEILAYVKIAESDLAKTLLRHESQTLREIVKQFDDEIPDIIYECQDKGWEYLFTTAPGNEYSIRLNSLGSIHADFILKTLGASKIATTLESYIRQKKLEKRLEEIGNCDDLLHSLSAIRHAVNSVKQYFSTKSLIVGNAHGDFVPWNLLISNSGKIFAYDWEYSEKSAPALNDAFHFVRSRCQHGQGWAAERTSEKILKHQIIASLAIRIGIERDDIPYYFCLYLLGEILRHAETDSSTPLGDQKKQVSQISYLVRILSAVLNSTKTQRIPRRLCISAYACEPEKGSEPGVGWNWVQLIAENDQAWVFTKANNREPIERFLKENPNTNLNFIYVDVPKWISFWKRGQRGVRTYYYLWQFFALKHARKLHKSIDFQLAHHVSFVNDWLWSFVGLMPVKSIWGPIGSHPPIPKCLIPHRKAKFDEVVRLSIQRSMRVVDPLYWSNLIRSQRVVVINKEIGLQFPISLFREKCIVESAIAHETNMNPAALNQKEGFDVLYVGRFHRTKCPHIAIEAFAEAAVNMPDANLIMIGRGPEQQNLQHLAVERGLKARIVFKDWCTQDEVLRYMARSSIFLFPSTEGGGMVVIEALSLGLPVVCLDYGGPGAMVTPDTGYLAPVTDRHEIVERLADALTDYYSDSAKLIKHSNQAKEHAVRNLSWKSKEKRLTQLYEEIYPAIELAEHS